jgi:PIN domain nuclease of toxin-antitoxin system
MTASSIAEELAERLAGRRLSRVRVVRGDIVSASKVEVLAIIAEMFLGDRICAAIAALMGHPCIIADTIQANPQILATAEATLAPAWLT